MWKVGHKGRFVFALLFALLGVMSLTSGTSAWWVGVGWFAVAAAHALMGVLAMRRERAQHVLR